MGSNASPLLIQHFQSELNQMFDTINKRAINLSNLETKVKSTRAIANSDFPSQGEKAKLLSENEQLINLAFHQEKISIIEHSKLRISHDLSKLCRFKRYVQDIIDGKDIDFNYEEEEIKSKKKQIENLKNAIEYEKSRIFSMQMPQFEINEAARLIQKNWRGYYQRQQIAKHYNDESFVEYEKENDEVEECNQDSSNIDSNNDYCDNSDEGDVIGVFNVTGVANTENGIEEEEKIVLAPADALDNHKGQNKSQTNRNLNDDILEKSPNLNESSRKNERDLNSQNKKSDPKQQSKGKSEIKINSKDRQYLSTPNRATNANTRGRLKLENLNQLTEQNAKSPINIKTYMSD